MILTTDFRRLSTLTFIICRAVHRLVHTVSSSQTLTWVFNRVECQATALYLINSPPMSYDSHFTTETLSIRQNLLFCFSVLQIEYSQALNCSLSAMTWSIIFWSFSAEEPENVLIFLTTFSCSLSTARQASTPPRELILTTIALCSSIVPRPHPHAHKIQMTYLRSDHALTQNTVYERTCKGLAHACVATPGIAALPII